MSENKSFEGHAILELFGHNVIAGYVSEESIGGASFVRVDVPPVDGCPGYTKFFGGAAIYAITPTDEETARIATERLRIRPVETWVVPSPKNLKLIPGDEIEEWDEFDDGFDYGND